MKKIILSAAVAAAALFGAYTAQQANEVAMNELQVENIEALGQCGEVYLGSGSTIGSKNHWVERFSTSRPDTINPEHMWMVTHYLDCLQGGTTDCSLGSQTSYTIYS